MPVTLKMVNVAYKYQNRKSVSFFMWHRSRRNVDGIVGFWYRSCSNIAGTPMPQFFPTGLSLHKFKIENFGVKTIFKYVSIHLQPIGEMAKNVQKNSSSTYVNLSFRKYTQVQE